MHSIFYSLCLTIVIFTIYIFAETNDVTFERMECITPPNSVVKIDKCVAKLMSHTHGRIDVLITLNRTINSLFANFVAYYQFSNNQYRQLFINVWEDFCATLNGTGIGNILANIIIKKSRNFTNAIHPCPFMPGQYFVKANNISANYMNFGQLLPAGRYRFDINWTEGYKGRPLGMSKTWVSISDHRIFRF